MQLVSGWFTLLRANNSNFMSIPLELDTPSKTGMWVFIKFSRVPFVSALKNLQVKIVTEKKISIFFEFY